MYGDLRKLWPKALSLSLCLSESSSGATKDLLQGLAAFRGVATQERNEISNYGPAFSPVAPGPPTLCCKHNLHFRVGAPKGDFPVGGPERPEHALERKELLQPRPCSTVSSAGPGNIFVHGRVPR
jgi:hypothetical protein